MAVASRENLLCYGGEVSLVTWKSKGLHASHLAAQHIFPQKRPHYGVLSNMFSNVIAYDARGFQH